MPEPLIYLDNAATSWPKPDTVAPAMQRYLQEIGASPGRSAHRLALEAERVRFRAREAVARLFGLPRPQNVVFTANATTAINLVLRGLLRPGDHVVATGLEHNAVMRPLRALQSRVSDAGRQVDAGGAWASGRCELSVDIAPGQPDGTLDLAALTALLRPTTRLIIVNHASNVCGTVLPVAGIAAEARRRRIPLLVDAAQTGGCWPIDLMRDQIDLLAFTGHKGLLGPTGTGGLAIHPDFDIEQLPPLVLGGTGSRSEQEIQPDFLPDKYEAGTPNAVGLAGLLAGMEYVLDRGVPSIREHEQSLTQRLIAGLSAIRGVQVHGPRDATRQTAVVSFTLAGRTCAELALALDEEFGVLCRPGLHCAPAAHRTLGTYPEGTVRFSSGPFSTVDHIDRAAAAVARLAQTSGS